MQQSPGPSGNVPLFQTLGCLSIVAALALVCLMPLLLVDAMNFALQQLDLRPSTAMLAVIGIFVGGLINLPLYHIPRNEEQVVQWIGGPFGGMLGPRQFRVQRRFTVVAVNVGGCIIPLMIALWQIFRILDVGGRPLTALLVATMANIVVCYLIARPVEGLGIVMPAFSSPAVAIGMACLLLWGPQSEFRAPVAFVAGVSGPLVGADLLHLKDITRVSTGMLSIGGAGTFDGIVLSGIGAAFVCGLLAT